MLSLCHENVLKAYSICRLNAKIFIIMKYMNQGSLTNVMSYNFSNGIKDTSILATIVKYCARALQFLHKNGIVHRDVKASNILIDSNGLVCLGDLGVLGLHIETSKSYSFAGSLPWMAPEVFATLEEGYNYKVK